MFQVVIVITTDTVTLYCWWIGQIAKYSICFMPKSALDSSPPTKKPSSSSRSRIEKAQGSFKVFRYSQVIHHDTPSVSVADKSSLEKYWGCNYLCVSADCSWDLKFTRRDTEQIIK